MQIHSRVGSLAVWCSFIISAVAGAVLHLLRLSYPDSHLADWALHQSHLVHAGAYCFIFVLCCKIRSDYPGRSAMRIAWNLMAAYSVASIVRNGFEWLAVAAGWTETMGTTVAGLRHVPLVLSLVFLVAGLVAMWRSFSAVGFGVGFRLSDMVLATLIMAATLWIFAWRAELPDHSAYAPIRLLQVINPVLIAGVALIGLGLHRISLEMEGGSMAVSLRYLVVFFLVRLALVANGLAPLRSPLGVAVVGAADWSNTWLFALAIVHRWQMTVSASELVVRYEADPEQEIAAFSQSPGTSSRVSGP